MAIASPKARQPPRVTFWPEANSPALLSSTDRYWERRASTVFAACTAYWVKRPWRASASLLRTMR